MIGAVNAGRWQAIKDTFDSLLDAEPAEQSRRLASLGEMDPELRDAVASLIAADGAAAEQLAALHGALVSASGEVARPFDHVGRTISHFRIVEPLGAGGMGIVYRAEDLRLGRDLALKFLLPDHCDHGRAKERFLQEARVAAAVDHPNLCTVLDVGESTDGDLFIAMVLYPGETLKARIERNGPLPISETISIARQISLGLNAAHSAGITHRDLKPGNVMLLSDGTVKILDFGLARAGDRSVSMDGGLRGTAPYMAPEQITGGLVDARTDLWALGVVLYEMLTAGKPFVGESDVGTAHAVLYDEPARVSRSRPDVPDWLATLTHRLLQKNPTKRFDSAAAFETALNRAGAATSGALDGATVRQSRSTWLRHVKSRRALVVAALYVPILAALVTVQSMRPGGLRLLTAHRWSLFGASFSSGTLDDKLMIVTPFRVTASDSSVRFLREGMMDLVSAKLTGSIRAVDTRAVLKAWHGVGGGDESDPDRAELIGMARHLGAGRILDGSIVETSPSEIAINGTLIDVRRPERLVSVATYGAKRDLATLVDAFMAQVVARGYVGVDESAAMLAETPFDALQAYLSGQFAFRGGQYVAAVQAFRRALEIDSTFALAAVRLDLAAAYTDARLGAGAIAIARAHRDKLGTIDRLILDTHPTDGGLEQLAVQQRAVQVAPDVPELWFNLGENFAHWGFSMGFDDAQQRALAAFDRAVAFDSLYAPARHHLLFCYSLLGDTAGIRRVLPTLDHRSERLSGYLWLALGNRSDLAILLRDSPRHRVPPWLITPAMIVGRFDDMEWAAHYMDSTAVTAIDRSYAAGFIRWLALNRGQPARARRVVHNVKFEIPPGPSGHELDPVAFTPGAALLEVLLWGADPRDAAAIVGRMNTTFERAHPISPAALDSSMMETFAVAEYAISRGQLDFARSALVRLRSDANGLDVATTQRARHAALLVAAQLASMERRSDAPSLASIADSVLRRVDHGSEFFDAAGSLFIARVWERLGNLQRAVAATARTPLVLSPFYSTYVREHARLSALAGDRKAAIEGYRRYIQLRSNTEASQVPDVDAARSELNRLLGDVAARESTPNALAAGRRTK